jgi:2-methylcitrate dehydratase PrpD
VLGAQQLVRDHHIPLDAIASIQVHASHSAQRLGTRLPATTEEAQFNQAWPLAAMLVDGEIGPHQLLEQRLSDPQIRQLAQKVQVFASEEMEALCRLFEQGDPRGRFASMVTITLQDGRSFHSGPVDGGLRFPPTGWDETRMAEKFRWLAGFVLNSQKVEEVLEMLWQFDRLPDVACLSERLVELNERRCD